jgi:hypothetical protein
MSGIGPILLAVLVAGVAAPRPSRAQDDTHEQRGRKYKAPPETARIEVLVQKGFNKKPIMNAAVIFHPIDADGKDEGTLEVKSGPDGKASIDVIPIGSQVRVQVLANGFATYAQDITVDSGSRSIVANMIRPQAQISAYQDNEGKPAQSAPGIQVPIRPKPKKDAGATGSSASGSDKTAPDSGSGGAGPDSSGSGQGAKAQL